MNNIKLFISAFLSLLFFFTVKADEGMWIPLLLEQLNQSDMQSMGLKLTAEDIYSINKSSLKDAVCLFGGGCTAEVVSEKGLILTNHHCAYSSIQSHSSLENNYLANGYWAKDYKSELPNSGLSVTFLVRMEDVTTTVLKDVNKKMSEIQRDDIIKRNIENIEKEAVKGTHYKAKVKSFYYGNEYYLFISEVFTDIRLVGAPPEAIGRFGGDTDNWAWPRHTGDFSVFRIYSDTNNLPADYSEKNVPYIPKKSLTISIKGVKKDDFTMVYGFPGKTQEYLTSDAVNLIGNIEDPAMVKIREKKLGIMGAAMKENKLVKLQYSDKYQSVANYWKKWKGESKGLRKLDAVEKKKKLEAEFITWANTNDTLKSKYGQLLNTFKKLYADYTPVALSYDYFSEAGNSNEIIKYVWGFNNLTSKCSYKFVKDDELIKIVEKLKNGAIAFFKNYDQPTDKKLFITLLKTYYENASSEFQPLIFSTLIKNKFNGDITKYADYLYAKSVFVSKEKIIKILNNFKRSKVKKIEKDPLFILASGIYNNFYLNILPLYNNYNDQLDSLYRIYIKGLSEMFSGNKFYPDANLTLRLTYGKIEDYKPMDAVDYLYFTTLDGMIEKEDTTIDDYKVPERLKDLYKKKDYGHYSDDSLMHIAFIADNHTSGGNSGSPVLNENGELIGINFDRVWEGTMSDIMFNPDQCRNISLDIRFALFVIDKYAGAKRLINEMKVKE